jgi:LysW-gamma-L-alpha-aminoadipyl-6-phosphate/LysW-L-glutamyl-5-phosphate reductase
VTVKVAILGGTGYGGMELLRLLLGHPEARVTAVTSRTSTESVGKAWPHLRGFTDLAFSIEDADSVRALARENDVLFQAKPHGVSAAQSPGLLDGAPRVKVIDLSGDFRLRDADEYATWYGLPHPTPDRLKDAVYGLPECGHREAIRRARLVANPGCHASTTILALWPLARAGLLAGRASVASVTGSSGSGSEPSKGTHHPERFMNFKAYKPLKHQHLPEIVAALGGQARVDFVPHSAPLSRGIHVTAFAPVKGAADAVERAFRAAYGAEPFVRLTPEPPEVRAVVGTNFADVHVTMGDGIACVTVVSDNLGKGMAGTAVQNMNLMLGLPETTGLRLPGAGL